MKIIKDFTKDDLKVLLARPVMRYEEISSRVSDIIRAVRTRGDVALREYAEKFDGVLLEDIQVNRHEIDAACARVDKTLADAIRRAKKNIEKFHAAQKREDISIETEAGVKCVQKTLPLTRVGIYIPGGSAPLFSTVLMLAVPAKLAGCKEVIMCTPTDKQGRIADAVLFAADLCGVDKIYKTGGAQAIAAMACGTESVTKVDKIFGPGNQYVTNAKQQVSVSDVAIDMPAGPSEVLVMADESAKAEFVAADLLSQAEHGIDSQSILVTDSLDFAEKVSEEVKVQLKSLSRSETAQKSIDSSKIFVCRTVDQMIEIANEYAAEHLIISMKEPWAVADKIEAAGSVFIGNYTPESAGDYASGTNHTLPTSGWARSYSGVNLDSFTKRVTYQEITKDGLLSLGGTIELMAQAEGLDAHSFAVEVRMKSLK